jgi:hypothetical protein
MKTSEPHTIFSVRTDLPTHELRLRLQERLNCAGPELIRRALVALESTLNEGREPRAA